MAIAGVLLVCLWVSSALAQNTNIVPTPGELGPAVWVRWPVKRGKTTNITGGLRPGEGANVFHSFNQFSVGQGHNGGDSFNPGGGRVEVISRVIGGSPSDINGTIQALGWNLYFMNPSGIIFGPSANLNVTGSAYFSTAQQLRLGDGQIFSTSLVTLDATLSTAAPAAFGFVGSSAPAPIVISGSNLTVSNNSLLLAGGSVQINGGNISAARTEVGAVGSGAEVNVDPGAGNAFAPNTPAGTLSAAVGTVIEGSFSVGVHPSSITVPAGAQVNQTTGPFGFVNRIEVVGGSGAPPPGTGLPPVVFPPANTNTQPQVLTTNPVDLVAFLNRAVTVMPQQAPAAPLALLTSRCAGTKTGEFSSFVQTARDVTPPQPGERARQSFHLGTGDGSIEYVEYCRTVVRANVSPHRRRSHAGDSSRSHAFRGMWVLRGRCHVRATTNRPDLWRRRFHDTPDTCSTLPFRNSPEVYRRHCRSDRRWSGSVAAG